MNKKIAWGTMTMLVTFVASIGPGCAGVDPEGRPEDTEEETDAEQTGRAEQAVQGAACNVLQPSCTGRNAANETCCGTNIGSSAGVCTDMRFDEDNCGACGHECNVRWVDGFPIGGTCVNGMCM